MSDLTHLEIIPLGGLGEFGMNLMLYRHGTDCLVVDAGMMFPGDGLLGVELIVPDLSALASCGTIHGVVLTHGHEDHIGAVPYLLAEHDVPVYGTRFVQGLVRKRLTDHPHLRDPRIARLPADGEPLQLGPFTVECWPTAHSIPESQMLLLRTPVGVLLHTADFKLDPDPPDGVGSDLLRLAALGREGVLALLSDSTNALEPGFTPGERGVAVAVDGLLRGCSTRVMVSCFASNVHRLQALARLAQRHGRRMALVGRSLESHADVAQQVGLLRLPPGVWIDADQAMNLPRERCLIVATGSQGESRSAAARAAAGTHRNVSLEADDLFIHSARVIPGNEKSIGRMVDRFLQAGVRVVTGADAPVHVSGHPSRDELGLLLDLIRPRFLVPIHGEYRQLEAHARLAVDRGFADDRVLIACSGDLIALSDRGIRRVGQVDAGRVLVDAQLSRLDPALLKDRRRVATDGLLVPVLTLDRNTGRLHGDPEIIARGFVPLSGGSPNGLLDEARRTVCESFAEASVAERANEQRLSQRIETDLKRLVRRRTRRRPLVVPVIVEL